MGRYFEEIDMTPGKATTVLMYMRTINYAIMGVNSQLVNLGKVWGSSFKCAKLMVHHRLHRKNVLFFLRISFLAEKRIAPKVDLIDDTKFLDQF